MLRYKYTKQVNGVRAMKYNFQNGVKVNVVVYKGKAKGLVGTVTKSTKYYLDVTLADGVKRSYYKKQLLATIAE